MVSCGRRQVRWDLDTAAATRTRVTRADQDAATTNRTLEVTLCRVAGCLEMKRRDFSVGRNGGAGSLDTH